MANPQAEDGHVDIANTIMDALARTRIAGEQRQCLDFIIRKTWGWKKKEDIISISQFNQATGIKKPHIIRALRALVEKRLIVAKNGNANGKRYRFNKNFDQWKLLPKKVTVAKNGILALPKMVPTKDTITKDIVEIVLFLNQTTKKNFKSTTKATRRLIKARFNEGFTINDFKTVISSKTTKWRGDAKMCEFLRPETLFGTKFESYLQDNPPPEPEREHMAPG